jgi:predicted DNA-binding transcriptional regulator YafY
MGRRKSSKSSAQAMQLRLLTCARRLLIEGKPVTASAIAKEFSCGIAAARRDLRWLRMCLPITIVDNDENRGRYRSITLMPYRRS